MSDCLFCKIAAGAGSWAYVIYADQELSLIHI